MDFQNPNQSLFSLRVNDNLRTQLKGAAAVAGVAAILSLVNNIIGIIGNFITMDKVTTGSRNEGFNQPAMPISLTANIFVMVVVLVIYVLLFLFLFRFSSKTKTGLNANSPEILNSGLGGLSAYFVMLGILLIICLAFGMLMLVLLVSVGAK